ncbi:unnamed protein product [Toxocara canis]|uniref:Uncharacterized protein n=1 Tax=Toxocara canis TaxID=6265 RepID=A0A183UKM2_TOXCA|nr:unnamed protein product [Toxocara canis]
MCAATEASRLVHPTASTLFTYEPLEAASHYDCLGGSGNSNSNSISISNSSNISVRLVNACCFRSVLLNALGTAARVPSSSCSPAGATGVKHCHFPPRRATISSSQPTNQPVSRSVGQAATGWLVRARISQPRTLFDRRTRLALRMQHQQEQQLASTRTSRLLSLLARCRFSSLACVPYLSPAG